MGSGALAGYGFRAFAYVYAFLRHVTHAQTATIHQTEPRDHETQSSKGRQKRIDIRESLQNPSVRFEWLYS